MKQKQYQPLSIAQMAFSLFSANEGFLDDVEVNKIVDFEAAMHSYVASNAAELVKTIDQTADYNDSIAGQMREAIKKFKASSTW